jgi:hypothetical protein
MNNQNKSQKTKNGGYKNLILIIVLLMVIVGIPYLLLNYQAKRIGLTKKEVISRITGKSDAGSNKVTAGGENVTGEKIDFLSPMPIGMEFSEPPLIAHIQAVDLDDDGLLDVIVCDDRGNFVSWIRQYPKGTFTEKFWPKILLPRHMLRLLILTATVIRI